MCSEVQLGAGPEARLAGGVGIGQCPKAGRSWRYSAVREVCGCLQWVCGGGGGGWYCSSGMQTQDCRAHGLPQPPPTPQWQINICEKCAQSEKKKRCNYVVSNEF